MGDENSFSVPKRKIHQTNDFNRYLRNIKNNSSKESYIESFSDNSNYDSDISPLFDILTIEKSNSLEIIPVIKKVKNKSFRVFLEHQVNFTMKYKFSEFEEKYDDFFEEMEYLGIVEIEEISYLGGLMGLFNEYKKRGHDIVVQKLTDLKFFLENNDPFYSEELFNIVCEYAMPEIFLDDEKGPFGYREKENGLYTDNQNSSLSYIESNFDLDSTQLSMGSNILIDLERPRNIVQLSLKLPNMVLQIDSNFLGDKLRLYDPIQTTDFHKELINLNDQYIKSNKFQDLFHQIFSGNENLESKLDSFFLSEKDELGITHIISLGRVPILKSEKREDILKANFEGTYNQSIAESTNLYINHLDIAESLMNMYEIGYQNLESSNVNLPFNYTYEENKLKFKVLYTALSFVYFLEKNDVSNEESLELQTQLYSKICVDEKSTTFLKSLEPYILQNSNFDYYQTQASIYEKKLLSEDEDHIDYIESGLRDDH